MHAVGNPRVLTQRIDGLTPQVSRHKCRAAETIMGRDQSDFWGKTTYTVLLSMKKRMGITGAASEKWKVWKMKHPSCSYKKLPVKDLVVCGDAMLDLRNLTHRWCLEIALEYRRRHGPPERWQLKPATTIGTANRHDSTESRMNILYQNLRRYWTGIVENMHLSARVLICVVCFMELNYGEHAKYDWQSCSLRQVLLF